MPKCYDVPTLLGPWATSDDGVPEAFRPQVTVYDEATGERIATVFKAEAIPLITNASALLAAAEGMKLLVHSMRNLYPSNPAAEWIAKQPSFAKLEAAIAAAKGE